MGRSRTDTSGSDSYFRGEIASINLVNRKITNSDLALFTLSPKGWMHKEHYDDRNDLIPSDDVTENMTLEYMSKDQLIMITFNLQQKVIKCVI